ncbi:MAG: hypothetical protein HQK54_13465 [Oligoflexales bacterium]|nr:hypothetical protein [Oligoflexales bacterium]
MHFYLKKQKNNILEIHGTLDDSVNLSDFNEMINDTVVIDFSSITEASWIGLTRFSNYLVEKAGNAVLINIPFSIYRYFRLVPEFGKRYRIGSFEIPVFNPDSPDGEVDLRKVEASYISDLLDKGMYDSLSEIGPKVDGKLIFWCPSRIPRETSTDSTFTNTWVRQNREEFCFWRNFIAFAGITIGLAGGLISSCERGLLRLLSAMTERTSSVEKEPAQIRNRRKTGLAKKTGILSDWISEECQVLSKMIVEVQNCCDSSLRRLQSYSSTIQKDHEKDLYFHFITFIISVKALESIIDKIEDVGVEFGEKLLRLKAAFQVEPGTSDIKDPDRTGKLPEQEDDFNAMDPLEKRESGLTRQDVFGELATIDSDTSRCAVLIQGFDLSRQLMEHRLIEANYLFKNMADIKNGVKKWTEAHSSIVEMIKDSMVTDQEKCAFFFFFSDFDTTEKKHAFCVPGEYLSF